MGTLRSILNSEVWQGLVSLSPFALAFFLFSFWEPLFTEIPDKQELKGIEGTVNSIGEKQGFLNTSEGNTVVNYECLCSYGWGEKAFKKGMAVYGLGVKKDDSYQLWELSIGDTTIFKYEDIAAKKLQVATDAQNIAIPGIVISILLLLQLGIQKIKGRGVQKEQQMLFDLLDQLADQSKSDAERLSYLDKILSYEASDTVEAFEFIAMNNSNSEEFLSKIGSELGRFWSVMEVEEIEAITFVQPAAKKSACRVMKSLNIQLFTKLEEVGAINA